MVSMKATMMAVMLLTVCVLATETAEYHCCRSYMKTKLPFRPIKGYTVQSDVGLCPISAIIFHTKKGRVCTDPALDWVMDYVNRLRAKAQIIHTESLFKE